MDPASEQPTSPEAGQLEGSWGRRAERAWPFPTEPANHMVIAELRRAGSRLKKQSKGVGAQGRAGDTGVRAGMSATTDIPNTGYP